MLSSSVSSSSHAASAAQRVDAVGPFSLRWKFVETSLGPENCGLGRRYPDSLASPQELHNDVITTRAFSPGMCSQSNRPVVDVAFMDYFHHHARKKERRNRRGLGEYRGHGRDKMKAQTWHHGPAACC